jgi:hypothetical protein
MQYLTDEGTVIHSTKGSLDRNIIDAPEWFVSMCSHVPNRGEQMVVYYKFFNTIKDYNSIGNPHFNSDMKLEDL